MAAVTTSISNSFVKIVWTQPATNSAPITAYEIVIEESDGTTFTSDSTNCDGSSTAIVSLKYCFVPMSALRASPFLLNFQDLIEVKVRAQNSVGWSSYSPLNVAGAQVQTEPT